MRKWKHTISFRHFWSEDTPIAEKSVLAAKSILKVSQHFPDDEDLYDIIEGFKGTTEVDEFDANLEDLYNWADDNRVWVATAF